VTSYTRALRGTKLRQRSPSFAAVHTQRDATSAVRPSVLSGQGRSPDKQETPAAGTADAPAACCLSLSVTPLSAAPSKMPWYPEQPKGDVAGWTSQAGRQAIGAISAGPDS